MTQKVLFFTDSFITGRGGIASYAHDFIKAFSSYEFVVITRESYDKKEAYRVFKINDYDFSLRNIKYVLKMIHDESPNIIVNSGFMLCALITPYISNDIKVISISHFTNGKFAYAAGLNGNYADSIVTLSTYAKRFIDKSFSIIDCNKTKIVYNSMPPKPEQYEKKIKQKVCRIVYPGGCAIAKSAEIVCAALKILLKTDLPFEFFWLGRTKTPGANWPYSDIKDISDCINVNDKRIMHIGQVPREKSKEIIASANIFLLPSRGEGCPITLLEAMRVGCIPIISDAKHGSLDLIENNSTGIIIKQGSPKAIVDAISDIIIHPCKYHHIYKNSYDKFVADLNSNKWAKCMNEILQSPLNHLPRKQLSKNQIRKDVFGLKCVLFREWLLDRIDQIYHILYFHYIKYFL